MKKDDTRSYIHWFKRIRELPLERLLLTFASIPALLILALSWMIGKDYFQDISKEVGNIIIFLIFFIGSLSGLTIAIMGEYPFGFPFRIKGNLAILIGLVGFLLGQVFACLALYNVLVVLAS